MRDRAIINTTKVPTVYHGWVWFDVGEEVTIVARGYAGRAQTIIIDANGDAYYLLNDYALTDVVTTVTP